jgi:hypothetical protein
MNTRKQVLIMTGLLLMMLVILGIYAAWYPYRAEDAQVHFDEATAERGAIVFARNCRLCHGDVGEGGALGARLPAAPPLHRADLMGFADSGGTVTSDMSASATSFQVSDASKIVPGAMILIDEEWMTVTGVDGRTVNVKRPAGHSKAAPHSSGATVSFRDKDLLAERIKLMTNTITCGRVGTAMPPWGQTQGGPLSDEQIRQLVVLITQSRWDLVKEEVDHEDILTTQLTEPMDDSTISMRVSDVSVFNEKEAIRMGDERMRVTGVPKPPNGKKSWGEVPARDRDGIIQVERGVLNSTPLEHTPEEEIFKFPEVATPAITQQSCGQFAQAPAPAGTPELIEPFTGQQVSLIAANLLFDKKEISVRPGGQVRIRLENRDQGVAHNVAVYKSATDTTAGVSPGSVGTRFDGPGIDDTAFDIPAAGNYFFRCDVHPQTMTGTFRVQ